MHVSYNPKPLAGVGGRGATALMPLPDAAGRQEILRVHTSAMQLASDVDLAALAADAATAGWSGAQLANLCREAGMHALREDLGAATASARHFAAALKELAPQI